MKAERVLCFLLTLLCVMAVTFPVYAKSNNKAQASFRPSGLSRRASLGNFFGGCWVKKTSLVITIREADVYLNPRATIFKANASGTTKASLREIEVMDKHGYMYLQDGFEKTWKSYYIDVHGTSGCAVREKPKGWISVGFME